MKAGERYSDPMWAFLQEREKGESWASMAGGNTEDFPREKRDGWLEGREGLERTLPGFSPS